MLQSALVGGLLGVGVVLGMAFLMPRPKCSGCGEQFPRFRAPASGGQAMRGGHTCRKCGQVCDRKGQPVR